LLCRHARLQAQVVEEVRYGWEGLRPKKGHLHARVEVVAIPVEGEPPGLFGLPQLASPSEHGGTLGSPLPNGHSARRSNALYDQKHTDTVGFPQKDCTKCP
ncbi:hypothetical protein AVEN_123372-1, partial [Araneus ventricosus]